MSNMLIETDSAACILQGWSHESRPVVLREHVEHQLLHASTVSRIMISISENNQNIHIYAQYYSYYYFYTLGSKDTEG